MKNKVAEKVYPNVDSMKKEIIKVWTTLMKPEYMKELARSMPRRILAVLANDGWSTKY